MCLVPLMGRDGVLTVPPVKTAKARPPRVEVKVA